MVSLNLTMPNQKPTALLMMSAAKGHLNASFGLARQVAASGYLVIYTIPFQMHQYVSQQGFRSVSLEGLPFGINGEKALDDMAQEQRVKYFDGLIDRFYDKIYIARKESIERLMAQTKPDTVFLDSFQSTDFILLYPLLQKYNCRIVFVQTMLSFSQQSDNLPLDCGIVPDTKTNFDWYWRRYYFKRWLRFVWDTVIYFGKSNRRVVAQKAKKMGVANIDYDQCFRIGFKDIPELIIAPQGLEFTTKKHPYQHYLGLMVDVERVEVVNESVTVLLTSLPADRKLIYCSLGTLYADYGNKKSIVQFFKNILLVATQLPDCEFIIGLSDSFRTQLADIPFNVHFFDYLPQITILKRCAVFVTHGGLNSIRESIALAVPMLVYPVDLRWDQPSNATKIAFHGLGLHGNMAKDNAQQIETKIKMLAQNTSFKERVLRLKNEDENKTNFILSHIQ
jgi:zeaxanthin glucosyltransferase